MPASPGRWQGVQFLKIIGAMCSLQEILSGNTISSILVWLQKGKRRTVKTKMKGLNRMVKYTNFCLKVLAKRRGLVVVVWRNH